MPDRPTIGGIARGLSAFSLGLDVLLLQQWRLLLLFPFSSFFPSPPLSFPLRPLCVPMMSNLGKDTQLEAAPILWDRKKKNNDAGSGGRRRVRARLQAMRGLTPPRPRHQKTWPFRHSAIPCRYPRGGGLSLEETSSWCILVENAEDPMKEYEAVRREFWWIRSVRKMIVPKFRWRHFYEFIELQSNHGGSLQCENELSSFFHLMVDCTTKWLTNTMKYRQLFFSHHKWVNCQWLTALWMVDWWTKTLFLFC